jgi:hypothetical protein
MASFCDDFGTASTLVVSLAGLLLRAMVESRTIVGALIYAAISLPDLEFFLRSRREALVGLAVSLYSSQRWDASENALLCRCIADCRNLKFLKWDLQFDRNDSNVVVASSLPSGADSHYSDIGFPFVGRNNIRPLRST